SLTACAPQSEVRQMHQSISTLNKEMTQLNQETVKITQQNKLNFVTSAKLTVSNPPATLYSMSSRLGGWRLPLVEQNSAFCNSQK
ncbi:DUF3251 domain-containing protein, partial [Salmonella enterica subsp. enterica serovar Anatum]|nr:DUF3251 domain-containing protein [Salmonella enterica subsp. enterica serovar Anatum]